MRDKVLKVLEIFAEGGSLASARTQVAISGQAYYRTLRQNPDLLTLCEEIRKARAEMMVDEAYTISTDASADPRRARVQADIRLKIAAMMDRGRFGERIAVEVEAGPSLVGALEAANRRALQPPSNLAALPMQQVIDVASTTVDAASDKQSGAEPADVPDAFRD